MNGFEAPPGRPESPKLELVPAAPQDPEVAAFMKRVEGDRYWIADETCVDEDGGRPYSNVKYFLAKDANGETVGLVGTYDAGGETNITHTVIDPAFRGRGLAVEAKDGLAEKLGLDHLTAVINAGNEKSLRSIAKDKGFVETTNEENAKNGKRVFVKKFDRQEP